MVGEIVIPFIGISFTLASLVVAAIALIIGFVIGNSAKSALKIILLIIAMVGLLFLIGWIPSSVTDKLKELFAFFQPFMSTGMGSLTAVSGTGGVPTIVLALAAGIILGWWRS